MKTGRWGTGYYSVNKGPKGVLLRRYAYKVPLCSVIIIKCCIRVI